MSSKQNVKEFWISFLKHQKALEVALDEQNKENINEIVHSLNDQIIKTCGCYLDVSKDDGEFYECTFLPMKDKTSQLLAAYLKKFAPASIIDSWIINECIPPLSEKAFQMNFDVKDLVFGVNDFEVNVVVNEEAKNFDLVFYCPAFEWMEDNECLSIVDSYLEYMIGSLMNEAYIQGFTCVINKELGDWVSMIDLFETLNDIIQEKKWTEFHDITTIYTAYKIEKEELKEERNHDKVVIKTTHPLLFVESVNHERFALDQANRLGAEFGTLSYLHEGYEESIAFEKKQLEQELNDLLYPLGIARVIGGAIGLNYCYIDVMIFDRQDFKVALNKINEKMKFQLEYAPM